ncbi:MAG TPA: DUF4097 family beta strand repeat-containing protein [Vicinamibacteria bacterium]|nr:DUF4097 family beta strand repeat-containing protein [Vicinamibacteria bacterium]
MKRAWMVGVVVLAGVSAAGADEFRAAGDQAWCAEERDGSRDLERYCEVREATVAAAGRIAVDATPNGGISAEAWDRNEVRVLAKVSAFAETEAEARRLVSAVTIRREGTIQADGPESERRRRAWWTVSYRLRVPARTDLDLRSMNGGIRIAGVRGHSAFETTNGGVSVVDAGGSVQGRTTNGGVSLKLSGDRWDGDGLDVQTTNGGVTIAIPEGYNAHLETGTVNGGIDLEFPMTVQGRIKGRFSTDLGSGGPTIRAVTTNGGVVVRRR